ncbi:MAG: 23S rRNA (guanosine(2251)-2'-O)-methyltransferase RlmB [Oscillospiraceae bacterium]|nr:23S rRNA (guanosine(2251)-2'-O)-methyltransferase RlmB [Oscillospiraceae bacterium]
MEASSAALVEGRRAVAEALRAGRPLDKLYVLRQGEGLGALVAQARAVDAVVIFCERAQLDAMSVTGAHHGVIASVAAWAYVTLEHILDIARAKEEPPFLVVCDGVEDPGNLGAILRTAEAAGAHGLVVPKRRSAGLSSLTAKASSGAVEYLPVARVPGIPALLRRLKEENIWIYGAAAGGEDLFAADFSGGVALVFGSEGQGLSRLTAEQCDFLLGIPMRGRVASLNVSAAAAVMMYAVVRSRLTGHP